MMRRSSLFLCLLALTIACTGAPVEDGDAPETRDHGAPAGTGWPGFGGPAGNFRVGVDGLAETWPEGGPVELWSRPVGKGYSGIAVDGELLFVVSREDDQDVLQARRVDDGSVVWEQRSVEAPRDGQTTDFGVGPNASPLVHGGDVFTLGFAGTLRAFERDGGEPRWSVQLVDDFGAEPLGFGFAASPIAYDGKLLVLCGGENVGVLALDPADGSVLWRGAPSSVSYATPIVIDLDGLVHLVYFSAEEIVGLDLADGKRLWSFPVVNQYRNNATMPLWGDDDLLWVATQLDGGTRALRLTRDGEGVAVEEVWNSNRLSVHFWNTLRLGDVVFASIGSNASILAGVDLTDGEILWRRRGFEQVNFVHGGDLTVLLDANGVLALARLSAEDIDVLARAVLSEERHWTAPALVGTTLYVRNESTLRAFDLSVSGE